MRRGQVKMIASTPMGSKSRFPGKTTLGGTMTCAILELSMRRQAWTGPSFDIKLYDLANMACIGNTPKKFQSYCPTLHEIRCFCILH
jgi:hypothetical protein